MWHFFSRLTFAAATFALFLWGVGPARADMVLTSAGIAQGFTLSTFASGFPHNNTTNQLDNIGPIGIAFPGSGVVLVGDLPFGNVYRFSTDTDGQTASTANVLGSYGAGNPAGMVSFNGVTVMLEKAAGELVALNPNTGSTSLIVGGLSNPLDVVANPLNGHYFVSTSTPTPAIADVNPVTHTFSSFLTTTGATYDGLTISPDGKTLYATGEFNETFGVVDGFDTATGALVFQSSNIPGGPDGTALGFGSLSGMLFANLHNGTLVEINMATGAQTVIASGGSRGDFVVADPYNGSLLVTQSDSVLRLTPPSDGSFAAPVPEPSSLSLLASGVAGLALWRRLRKRERLCGAWDDE